MIDNSNSSVPAILKGCCTADTMALLSILLAEAKYSRDQYVVSHLKMVSDCKINLTPFQKNMRC